MKVLKGTIIAVVSLYGVSSVYAVGINTMTKVSLEGGKGLLVLCICIRDQH